MMKPLVELALDHLEWLKKDEGCWPMTVIPSRYGGCYEGGAWLAFPLTYDLIPDDVYGCDYTCPEWFDEHEDFPIGRGKTPQEAVDDLINKPPESHD